MGVVIQMYGYPFILLALSSILKKLGCNVENASNGKVGVEMVIDKVKHGNSYEIGRAHV